MKIIVCKVCGKEFGKKGSSLTCSDDCHVINCKRIKREYYERNTQLVKDRAAENRRNDPAYNTKVSIHRAKNKDKINERQREYRENNPDQKKKHDADYRERHKDIIYERHKQFILDNPEKESEYGKRYSQTDKGRLSNVMNSNKRRCTLLQALPDWADLDKIKDIYLMASEVQWLSEEKLEVDHIIPLQGTTVCGLHVPWNLRIIPSGMNRSKGNKLLEELI